MGESERKLSRERMQARDREQRDGEWSERQDMDEPEQ